MTARPRAQDGQASVETALVLPVLVVVIAAVLQVGLLVRDRVVVVHATRAAARAVAVQPGTASARRAVEEAGLGDRADVAVGGSTTPGGLAQVTVRARPTLVPLVGRAVAGVRLEERLVVRVEG